MGYKIPIIGEYVFPDLLRCHTTNKLCKMHVNNESLLLDLKHMSRFLPICDIENVNELDSHFVSL